MTRWLGSAVVAAALAAERGLPFAPRDRLEALRDRRIRHIVGFAARTVPYYRELFRRERIDPRDVRGARDLERLPRLDRAEVRCAPERFVSTSRRAADAVVLRSSGSTGAPLEVRHDRRSLLRNIAYGERERAAVRAACGGAFRPKEVYLGFATSNFREVLAFYETRTWLPRPRRTTVSMTAPPAEIAAAIDAERPDVLVGYGGFLDDFYRTVVAEGRVRHRPRVVMYVGERLPAERRAWIESTTGARVMSRYCAVESLKIGYFCEARTGFHVHEDLCHVTIADRDGRAVPDGEPGEVVLSNLVNHGTVLLNYPMGDVAAFQTMRCPCGRTHRLLGEIEGRVEDALVLADGRSLHPRAIWAVVKDERAVLRYQLVQHAIDRFELRLALIDGTSLGAVRERTTAALRRLLGDGADVAVVLDPRLAEDERRTSGKFRAVLSALPRAEAAPQASAEP